MAWVNVNFFSDSLRRSVDYQVVIPNDMNPEMVADNIHYKREMKSLYLLHGYSDHILSWMNYGNVQDLSYRYHLAIIMPKGENSFYLDQKGTGSKYGTYVGEEIVRYTQKLFGLSSKKEDNWIGGYSMGGFGAIHTGLKYSETFEGIIALSSALIVNGIKGQKEGFDTGIADYDYYYRAFGDLDQLAESENNPEVLVHNLKQQGGRIPKIYMACGTEDFLLNENREFSQFLKNEQVPVEYKEGPGMHNWEFWNPWFMNALEWALTQK